MPSSATSAGAACPSGCGPACGAAASRRAGSTRRASAGPASPASSDTGCGRPAPAARPRLPGGDTARNAARSAYVAPNGRSLLRFSPHLYFQRAAVKKRHKRARRVPYFLGFFTAPGTSDGRPHSGTRRFLAAPPRAQPSRLRLPYFRPLPRLWEARTLRWAAANDPRAPLTAAAAPPLPPHKGSAPWSQALPCRKGRGERRLYACPSDRSSTKRRTLPMPRRVM